MKGCRLDLSELIFSTTKDDACRLYLKDAYQFAWEKSHDVTTKNGAIIVTKFIGNIYGANQCPPMVKVLNERLERPLKYDYIEHAERDAVYKAANIGLSIKGATMYVPWAACADCARAIILSGIERVVVHKQMVDKTPDRWCSSTTKAIGMFNETGVKFIMYDGVVGEVKSLFDGMVWEP